MSGLMMVFLFIAITLMRESMIAKNSAEEKTKKVEQIVRSHQDNQVAIYDALNEEFSKNLLEWDAKIDRDLTFTFKSPDILFAQGEIALTPKFKQVLYDFFPRYLKLLTEHGISNDQGGIKYFKDSINEIRIEGHTNSIWSKTVPEKQAYYLNMELSQGRTRSVLTYIYDLPSIDKDRPWVKSHIAAVGFSSSRPIYKENTCQQPVLDEKKGCMEDLEQSRRVSFRIITNSDAEIQKILATF
jgi:outer membrane protein OmpA-like peptidoglycan-associated protein